MTSSTIRLMRMIDSIALRKCSRNAVLMLCAIAISGLAACENEGGFQPRQARAGQSSRVNRIAPSPMPANRGASTSEPSPAGEPPSLAERPVPSGELLRIDLVSGPVVPGEDPSADARKTRLHSVAARPCGRMLEMLYPALNGSGSQNACFLIYQDKASWTGATAFIPQLDAPDRPSTAGGGAEATFTSAVRELMRFILTVAAGDDAAIRSCRAAFVSVRGSPQAPPALRWASAMLAGRIDTDFLFDFKAARQNFAQAETFAVPGSIEQMNALFAGAQAAQESGQHAAYRDTCTRIVSEFPQFADAQAFQRAQRGMQGR